MVADWLSSRALHLHRHISSIFFLRLLYDNIRKQFVVIFVLDIEHDAHDNHRTYRTLVDIGMEVSVISIKVYEFFQPRLELERKDLKLRTVNGSPLLFVDLACLQFRIGNQSTPHDFFVVKNLKRNLELDRDWLMQNGLRMHFDLGALRITGAYVALEENVYIPLIIRIVQQIILTPQDIHTYMARSTLKNVWGKVYEIEQLNSRYARILSGVLVANAMVKLNKSRSPPLVIMNNTNQLH